MYGKMGSQSLAGLIGILFLVGVTARGLAPAPAPGPDSSIGCYTALNILEASGQHNTLLTLLDSTNLTAVLDNPSRFVTLLAPTDAGIAQTLRDLNGTLQGLENSTAVQPVLQYHILPSPVMFTAFQNGNSFNTALYQGRNVQTISVNRTMNHVTIEGAFSNANLTNTGTAACGSQVYSLDGLLVPLISLSFLSG